MSRVTALLLAGLLAGFLAGLLLQHRLFVRWREALRRQERVYVLVAKDDLPAGKTVKEGQLRVVGIARGAVPVDQVTEAEEHAVVGAIPTVTVAAEQQLLWSHFARTPQVKQLDTCASYVDSRVKDAVTLARGAALKAGRPAGDVEAAATRARREMLELATGQFADDLTLPAGPPMKQVVPMEFRP